MSDRVRFSSAGPLSLFAIVLLIALLILIVPLLILGVIGAAFTRLGFSWISALAIVLLMLFGSFVNIPVYKIRRKIIRITPPDSSIFGEYNQSIPSPVWDTSIAIILGGAVIPVAVSLYMLYQAILITGASQIFSVCVAIILVAAITYVSTRYLPGFGIQVSMIIPGLTALLAGLMLSGGTGLAAAVTAFVSGITGTLLGGNIAQIFRIKDLDVPSVSIGGAGTFGAVFICCILPALIA
jgi:uncharacterized membrane protein